MFRPDRKEFKEEKPEDKGDEDIVQPNFIVRGITIFGDKYKASIIEKQPPKQSSAKPARSTPQTGSQASIPPKIYKEGDSIDSDWIIKKIYNRRVEFCHGGNCFFVSLYKTYEDENYIPPKSQPATPGPAKAASNPSPPGAPPRQPGQQPASSQPPEFTAEEFKKLIQQGGRSKP